MPKVFPIIQARMSSTRLPGKVMMELTQGKPVLQIMVERLPSLRKNIIIATTNDGSEQPIIELCQRMGIKYYCGDTENVLSRYWEAAQHFDIDKDDIILRLTSDCPLIDEGLTLDVINKLLESHYDMVSLGPHSGFPRGLDVCAFRSSLLDHTYLNAISQEDKEHVTLGFAKFSSLSTYIISAEEDLTHWRLTLDEPDDYACIRAVFDLFDDINFKYSELNKKLKENPDIAKINRHVCQKVVN